MKGGIAAMLAAVLETDWKKMKKGIKLYFTYDEEIGFNGIKDVLEYDNRIPDNVIIGEPTNNILMNGSKGLLEFKINFKGIAAHSSAPNEGVNAIENCMDFLKELKLFYNELKEEKNNSFKIPYTTMNIGKINGGISVNIIPNDCEVMIDFRAIKNEHVDLIISKVETFCNKYDGMYEIINNIKPFISDSDYLSPTNFITEASFIESKNRLILGPGPVNPHEANEYITEESLNKTVEQYKQLIKQYCKFA